jgi:hypothetical protein
LLLSPLSTSTIVRGNYMHFLVVTGIVCTGGTLDWKVLWSRGTRGRGTFRMYPSGRFPKESDLARDAG